MIKILKEYMEDDKRIIEYTKDGETVSHRVIEDINQGSDEDFEIIIPKNPIAQLQEKNAKLEEQLQSTADMVDMLLEMKMGGM